MTGRLPVRGIPYLYRLSRRRTAGYDAVPERTLLVCRVPFKRIGRVESHVRLRLSETPSLRQHASSRMRLCPVTVILTIPATRRDTVTQQPNMTSARVRLCGVRKKWPITWAEVQRPDQARRQCKTYMLYIGVRRCDSLSELR